jgi:hypothetical protein
MSRGRLTAQTAESQLDWRERANDDLVLALAIAAWQAERNPGLGPSHDWVNLARLGEPFLPDAAP